jgi:hypothetical protein
MNKPQPGYYRNILTMYPKVRIAFTHTPIIGCSVVDNSKVLEALKESKDEYAQYYIDGLENKNMVTIVENEYQQTWANNGELYFKS